MEKKDDVMGELQECKKWEELVRKRQKYFEPSRRIGTAPKTEGE